MLDTQSSVDGQLLKKTVPASPRESISAVQAAVLFVGSLVYMAAFFPGSWSADPIWAMMEIQGIEPVNNWHPPVITLLWHGLWLLLQHHGLLWLVQTGLYFAASYLLSTFIRPKFLSLVTLLSLLFLPPLMANFAIFWKDNWFVLFGILAYGFLFKHRQRKDSRSLLCSVLFAFLFFSTRYNAFVAAAPLFVSLGWALYERYLAQKLSARSRIAKVSIACLGAFLLAVGSLVINGAVASVYVKKKYDSWQILPFYDMTGISLRVNQLVLPRYVLDSVKYRPTISQLAVVYNTTTSDPIVWNDQAHYRFPIPNATLDLVQTRQQVHDIFGSWLTAIMHHPKAYLSHRKALFWNHLGIHRPDVYAPYMYGIIPNRFGWTFERSAANIAMYWKLDALANGILFRGYLYLALSVLLLVLCIAMRSSLLTCSFAASGLLMFVGNFFLLAAADFRYLLWAIVVCVATPGLIWTDWAHRRPTRT